jgi:Fur family transcriptional regulator, stress-responsive regulator
VVAEVLEGAHVHLTADEVRARAMTRLPEISRATVYNVLRSLTALGEIVEVAAKGRAKRYDPNARDPHQHLRCERCGTIRDVHPEGQQSLRLPRSERYDFALTGVDIVFRGLCPRCRSPRG